MTDLNSKYNELIFELNRNYIFYLSKSILELKEFQNLSSDQKNKIDKYLDKILCFDNENNPDVESSPELETLLLKITKLKNNSFKLISYKETLSEISFDFLSENYLTNLEALTSIANIFVNYFQVNTSLISDTEFTKFLTQKNIYDIHLLEVKKIIGLSATELKNPTIIDINKHFENLKEKEVTPLSLPQIEKNIKQKVAIKPFREFIKHKKNIEIEKLVKQHFSDYRGVPLRYLIEYFIEKEVLNLNHGDKTKIYESITELFENKDIGVYNSVFDIKYFTLKDKNYIKTKIVFEKFFENIFNTNS